MIYVLFVPCCVFLCLEILSTMPTAASDMASDVPPWLMKTSGTPVSGKTPTIEAMFKSDCAPKSMMIPVVKSRPKESGA